MAKIIIKAGTREKITCEECGCYFSYEEEDIERPGIDSRAKHIEFPTVNEIVRCPQCECVIKLNRSK